MKLITFVGPPGCGKGTQAQLITNDTVSYICVGDLLREHIKNNDDIGQQISTVLSTGALISDNIVCEIVERKIFSNKSANIILLDGYPRSTVQANRMIDISKEHSFSIYNFVFDIEDDVITNRLTSRAICRDCGNIESIPGDIKDKKCNKCKSTNLYRRDDDKVEIISKRLSIYHSTKDEIMQMLETYPTYKIDCNKNKESITKEISEYINKIK